MSLVWSDMRCKKCGRWFRLLFDFQCPLCGSSDLDKEEDW